MVLTVTNHGNATAYDVTVDISASEVCRAKSDTPDELYEVIIPLRVYAQGNRVLSEEDFEQVVLIPSGVEPLALDAHFLGFRFSIVGVREL